MEAISKKALRIIADRFKLLSSPTRLEILQHICHRERSVNELVELTGFKQANVSKQLSLLDRAGLVRRRTEGNHVYYTAADGRLPQLCAIMHEEVKAAHGELLASLGDRCP
jgi:ArsR family transcriptional regulator, zinc-responsive transcriptional repressor